MKWTLLLAMFPISLAFANESSPISIDPAEPPNAAEQPPAASEKKPQAEASTLHTVCTEKVKGKTYWNNGESSSAYDEDYKTTDVTVKIWKSGDTEYRFADGTSLRPDGSVQNLYRAFSVQKTVVRGDVTIETFESKGASNFTGDILGTRNGDRLRLDEGVYERTYKDLGNGNKQIVKNVRNGKEQHAGAIINTSKFDGSIIERTVEATPYRQESGEGSYDEIEYDEMICIITPVK